MIYYKDYLDEIARQHFDTVTDNKQITYFNIESAFDIETTSYKTLDGTKHGFMYIWQFGIGYENKVIYGRTWNEFLDLMEYLSELLELGEFRRLVVYVHNLGYEFQFMYKYFHFLDVFSVDERKPLKALTDLGIEFRCSNILSGYSLANTAKNLSEIKIDKLNGDLDYSLIRHHKTPLTAREMAYCEHDVKIVLAYIKEQIKNEGDISKIPLTNTGRVRKYVRNNCYNGFSKKGKGANYRRYARIMSDLTLDTETYIQLKRAFMGGFTHANANYVGKVLENVSSIDFTSSYPSVMVSELFPMSRFKPFKVEKLSDFDTKCKKYAVVFDARFHNLRPKIKTENYISLNKCFEHSGAVLNNGRVNSAEMIAVTLTNVDYDIMKQCYEWDNLEIANAKFAILGYLPTNIIKSILYLYQKKTELKDVSGYEVEYLLSKGMLNSVYGMSVTDVVKDKAIFNGVWQKEKVSVNDEIETYNKSRNRFLYYAWGLWVTAYARRNLWTGIIAIGGDYIYSDTDSLKLLNYEKHSGYIDWFNKQMMTKLYDMAKTLKIENKLFAPETIKGVKKPLGVWDFEGTYKKFKTLGAKRYLVFDGDKLQLTVAGLSKQNGVNYMLEKSDGNIDKVFEMFNDRLYIPKNQTGKMTHTYIDNEQSITIADYLGNEQKIYSLSATHLEPCEFTLNISDSFNEFLKNLSNGYIYKGLDYK